MAKTAESTTTEVSVSQKGGAAPQNAGPPPAAPDAGPPPAPLQQPLPPMPKNELMAALSSGFAKASIAHFGNALAMATGDESVASYYQEIGQDVKMALHDRWNKREFDNFKSQYLDPMNQQLGKVVELRKNLFNALNQGKVLDPATGEVVQEIDPTSPEAMLLKQNYERDAMEEFNRITGGMMDASQKFANNPYVNDFMQSYVFNQARTIGTIIQPANKGLGPKDMAEIGLLKAQTHEAQMAARYRKAQTKKLAEEAKDWDKKPLYEYYQAHGIDKTLSYLQNSERGRELHNRYRERLETQLGMEYAQKHKLDLTLESEQAKVQRWLALPEQQAMVDHGANKEVLRSDPVIFADLKAKAAQNPEGSAAEMITDPVPEDIRIKHSVTSPAEITKVAQDGYDYIMAELADAAANNPDLTVNDLIGMGIEDALNKFFLLAFAPTVQNGKAKQEVRKRIKTQLRRDRSKLKSLTGGVARSGGRAIAGAVRKYGEYAEKPAGAVIDAVAGFGKGLLEEEKPKRRSALLGE